MRIARYLPMYLRILSTVYWKHNIQLKLIKSPMSTLESTPTNGKEVKEVVGKATYKIYLKQGMSSILPSLDGAIYTIEWLKATCKQKLF